MTGAQWLCVILYLVGIPTAAVSSEHGPLKKKGSMFRLAIILLWPAAYLTGYLVLLLITIARAIEGTLK